MPFLVRLTTVDGSSLLGEPAPLTAAYSEFNGSGTWTSAAFGTEAVGPRAVGTPIPVSFQQDLGPAVIAAEGSVALGAAFDVRIVGGGLAGVDVTLEQQRDLELAITVPGSATGPYAIDEAISSQSLGYGSIAPGLFIEPVLHYSLRGSIDAAGFTDCAISETGTIADAVTFDGSDWTHARAGTLIPTIESLSLHGPTGIDLTLDISLELRLFGALSGNPMASEPLRLATWYDDQGGPVRAAIRSDSRLAVDPGGLAWNGSSLPAFELPISRAALWSLGQPSARILERGEDGRLSPDTYRVGESIVLEVALSGWLPDGSTPQGRLSNAGVDSAQLVDLTRLDGPALPGGDERWQARLTVPATWTPGAAAVAGLFGDALAGSVQTPAADCTIIPADQAATVAFADTAAIDLIEGADVTVTVRMDVPARGGEQVVLAFADAAEAPSAADLVDPTTSLQAVFAAGEREVRHPGSGARAGTIELPFVRRPVSAGHLLHRFGP